MSMSGLGFSAAPASELLGAETFGKCDVPFEMINGVRHWEVCPTIRPARPSNAGFVDITGERFGALVVYGIFVEKNPKGTAALWVVKCDCGGFEIRTARQLRKANATASCQNCWREEVRKNYTEPRSAYALRRLKSLGGVGRITPKGLMYVDEKGAYISGVKSDIWFDLLKDGMVQINTDGRIGLTNKGRAAAEASIVASRAARRAARQASEHIDDDVAAAEFQQYLRGLSSQEMDAP